MPPITVSIDILKMDLEKKLQLFEGNDPEHSVKISYNQLLKKKYLNLQML